MVRVDVHADGRIAFEGSEGECRRGYISLAGVMYFRYSLSRVKFSVDYADQERCVPARLRRGGSSPHLIPSPSPPCHARAHTHSQTHTSTHPYTS